MRAVTMSLAASLFVVGCYDGGGDLDGEGGSSGGEDASDGGDGGDGGDGDDGGGDPQARCETSKLGPPMLRRLTQAEFDATVRAVFPEIADDYDGVAIGADTVSPLGFRNDAEVLGVAEQTAREILQTGEDVADLITAPDTLAQVLPCSTGAADDACVQTFVERYGARLFRRTLREEEIARYVDLWRDVAGQSDFATGTRWVTVAMIQSPHAVYRSELGEGDGAERELTGWELATALAYDFSGRPPDDALRAMGEAGELADPEVRTQIARDMLATAEGRETLDRFFEDWLDYRRVLTQIREEVPAFEAARVAMTEETRRFIDQVVVAEGGGVRELLLSPSTSLDPELSAFYGYGDVQGGAEVVERPEAWSVGLLAQGSVLAANAHGDASSPTQRGLLVYERLLCRTRPPVPADIPPIEPPSPGVTTTRQRYEEQHIADESCNSCHKLFDPLGFAFEHFDAAGRYRADEGGLPIDASGSIPAGIADAESAFDGLTGLSEALAEQSAVVDCVSGLTATYVFGGAGGQTCLAEEARSELAGEEIGLAEYVARLAAAPNFSSRRMP